MKLPKKVNVMGEVMKIKEVKNDDFIGWVDVFNRTIEINTRVSEKLQLEALIHEMAEYILYRDGCTTDNREKTIRRLNMNHNITHKDVISDTFVIFINHLVDTLVRNKLIK